MTGPEHDPAVETWVECAPFAGPVHTVARNCKCIVIPSEQFDWLKMPDRWEGDDS